METLDGVGSQWEIVWTGLLTIGASEMIPSDEQRWEWFTSFFKNMKKFKISLKNQNEK